MKVGRKCDAKTAQRIEFIRRIDRPFTYERNNR